MYSLLLVVAAIVLFFVAARLLNWQLVIPWETWRASILKKWSTWLNATGLVNLLLAISIDPTTGLSLWNMMPPHVRALIPAQYLIGVGAALWVLAWLSTYVKQPKLEAKLDLNKENLND